VDRASILVIVLAGLAVSLGVVIVAWRAMRRANRTARRRNDRIDLLSNAEE
jgi:Tfp pilus assembly protein PilN